MKNIEVLAPVGGREQLEAAVRSGADAVYFGASSFNARRNAQNFTDDDFIGAVRYCRERGVRVYITLNTLIKDSETEQFNETLSLIAKSGADAVIIQDMGVYSRVKHCCPEMPIHASTQMAVHNVSGARLLEEMGFSRIVLARELSIKEIKEITSSVGIETEVFVHGAHCMSASGMCYMSSFIGARSGNRGLCAQPCRLNFRYKDREYALSLKDMCLAEHIGELISAGVSSLKIEGRMKRPEYVASAVTAYKNAVRGEKADTELLKNVFSRSGFTDGYFTGRHNITMFGYRTKDDVLSAADVLSGVANTYRNENPLIPVNMSFKMKENENTLLTLTDGKNEVTVTGPVPEKAEKVPLNAQSVCRSLNKLGSTFYYADKITCDIEDGLMLRASDINAMRREATEKLTEKRGEKKAYRIRPYTQSEKNNKPSDTKMWLMFRHEELIPQGISADRIILPINEILKNKELISLYGEALTAQLPALIYPVREKAIREALTELKGLGVQYTYCDNIGAIKISLDCGMIPLGGTLLNVINSEAAERYYRMGVKELILSPEISFKELKGIDTSCNTGIAVYGYMPLMHFRCCPLQGEKGCGDCKGKGMLTDRRNEKFPVLCEAGQYSVLYNTVPLYIGDKGYPEVSHILLKFSEESKDNIRAIIYAVKTKKSLPCKKTAGLYEREII